MKISSRIGLLAFVSSLGLSLSAWAAWQCCSLDSVALCGDVCCKTECAGDGSCPDCPSDQKKYGDTCCEDDDKECICNADPDNEICTDPCNGSCNACQECRPSTEVNGTNDCVDTYSPETYADYDGVCCAKNNKECICNADPDNEICGCSGDDCCKDISKPGSGCSYTCQGSDGSYSWVKTDSACCEDDSECGTNQTCVNNKCQDKTCSGDDCCKDIAKPGSGCSYTCQGSDGSYSWVKTDSACCENDNQCFGGTICQNHRCETPTCTGTKPSVCRECNGTLWGQRSECCTSNSDCTQGRTLCSSCISNKCHYETTDESSACCQSKGKKYCSSDNTCIDMDECCYSERICSGRYGNSCVNGSWRLNEGYKSCGDGSCVSTSSCCDNEMPTILPECYICNEEGEWEYRHSNNYAVCGCPSAAPIYYDGHCCSADSGEWFGYLNRVVKLGDTDGYEPSSECVCQGKNGFVQTVDEKCYYCFRDGTGYNYMTDDMYGTFSIEESMGCCNVFGWSIFNEDDEKTCYDPDRYKVCTIDDGSFITSKDSCCDDPDGEYPDECYDCVSSQWVYDKTNEYWTGDYWEDCDFGDS